MSISPHVRPDDFLKYNGSRGGFTLVELLVASAVLILLLGMLLSATDSASTTVRYASAKIEAFAGARSGFDVITQKLSEATLNTYWDYYDTTGSRRTQSNAGSFTPSTYGRASDLQFLVRNNTVNGNWGHELFFQTPDAFSNSAEYLSTRGLLNTCGFFVRYGSNADFRPRALGTKVPLRYRYRLMATIEPTENFSIYTNAATDNLQWATTLATGTNTKPLVDNVIALIVWPRLSLGEDSTGSKLTENFCYDSQKWSGSTVQPITFGQLPPTVQMTIVIIDEASASRLDNGSGDAPGVIEAALKDKFHNVLEYQKNLNDLETALAANRINYQILTTSVIMRESKWSQ
jgi:uncharacterized protein (TIGR02599 family)